MIRHNVFLIIIYSFVSLFILFGCGPSVVNNKISIHELYEKNFEGIKIPDANWIKQGKTRSFSQVEFDQVWDSVILVTMQQGIIVYSSKDSGIIMIVILDTKLPIAIFIERKEPDISLYLRWIDYYRSPIISDDNLMENKINILFSRFETQLYEKPKWKWLKNE